MPQRPSTIYRTLVLPRGFVASHPLRRYRRYLRLMESASLVWPHRSVVRHQTMAEEIDVNRRQFLGNAAMAIAANLGMSRSVDAMTRSSSELAAIGRAVDWINSPRLTPAALAGKIVLVDFWTYTCINWLRTLPCIRA